GPSRARDSGHAADRWRPGAGARGGVLGARPPRHGLRLARAVVEARAAVRGARAAAAFPPGAIAGGGGPRAGVLRLLARRAAAARRRARAGTAARDGARHLSVAGRGTARHV